MKNRGGLRAGFAALGRGRLILLLTVSAILLGGFTATTLGPSVRDGLAHTLAGDHLIRNHPEFAPVDFIDFVREKAAAIAGARHAALAAGALGLLLQIFFVGGIVETLGREPIGPGAFWAGGRRHFAHNLKCFAIFTVAVLVVVVGFFAVALGVGSKVFEDSPPNSTAGSVSRLVTVVVAIILFGVLKLWSDFARAARRDSPEVGALAAFGQAHRRLRGRWLRGLGLLLFWAVAGAAGIVLMLGLAWSQATPSAAAVAVNLLLLVLLLAVRPAALVGAWGSILQLSDTSPLPPRRDPARPAYASMPAPEGSPVSSDPVGLGAGSPHGGEPAGESAPDTRPDFPPVSPLDKPSAS